MRSTISPASFNTFLTAQASVDTAQNSFNLARAQLVSDQAKNENGLDTARSNLDIAVNTVLAAQQTLTNDGAKQAGSVQSGQNTVDQARASLVKAQRTLEQTTTQQATNVQSAQNTVDQNVASVRTQQANLLSTAAPSTREQVAGAQAQTENARAALQLARNNLEAATLIAPVTGVVATVNGSVGQWISGAPSGSNSASSSSGGNASNSTNSGSASSASITLTDVSQPQVVPQVSEADIGRVNIGQPVSFTVSAYPDQTFTGHVTIIEPSGQTSSNVVTYNVRSSVDPNQQRLLPNMTATVTIVTEEDDNTILVPNAAVAAQTSSSSGVLVMRNGAPVLVPVQLGSTDGVNTQVLTGLQPGEQVVTMSRLAKARASTPSAVWCLARWPCRDDEIETSMIAYTGSPECHVWAHRGG